MNIPQFNGVICVITTPFDDQGAVNHDVLSTHVNMLIDQGVHALLPGGSTGEFYTQSLDERKKVLLTVSRAAGGRVPLYAGTNSSRVSDIHELNSYAAELGYEAVMLSAPYYALPSTGELIGHYKAIAETSPLPIILYNFPARTGVDMDAEFLEGVRDVQKICAIKESSGSMGRYFQHMLKFPHLQRICGCDDQAFDHFVWGTKSWIAGASNFLPQEHAALYQACVVEGNWQKGKDIMLKIMPTLYLLENGGKFIQYVKYGCELAGIAVGACRAPLAPLNTHEKTKFRAIYEALKAQNIT